MRAYTIVLATLFILLFSGSLYAQAPQEKISSKLTEQSKVTSENEQEKPFYQSPGKEGWWWYKDYVKEKKEKQESEVKKEPEEKPEETAKKIKPLKEYKYEELLRMHPDEFKEVYDYYLKLAVQNPTEENVYNFYNLQDVARKKALLFTNMSGYIWQKYPELSTERDIPIVGPGLTAQRELVKAELMRYKEINKSQYGYIVFVQPGCEYCEAQLRILQYAQAEGVDVKVVDITKNPSAVKAFGIELTPTIIVVDKQTGKYMPISSGVIALDEIYTRTSRAIRLMRGESPESYGVYEFQRGTSLDPAVPPPLWKEKKE